MLSFAEIMNLMDEDPDNPAIYDQEPQVDPIPFQEALTEAENMKHSIIHFQKPDHTTNDLMRSKALVLGSIIAASHANGFAGIAIDAFLSALLYELGMSASPIGKINWSRSSPLIIVPFLAPPDKQWPSFLPSELNLGHMVDIESNVRSFANGQVSVEWDLRTSSDPWQCDVAQQCFSRDSLVHLVLTSNSIRALCPDKRRVDNAHFYQLVSGEGGLKRIPGLRHSANATKMVIFVVTKA